MAIYTNTMRFTGLSGIDTESMVTALMKAEGMRLDKLKQQNQLTLWRQTAYYNMADVFRTFQNNFLALGNANSARLSSTYLRNTNTVKTTAGTDSTAVRVTSSTNAEIGKYTIDVKQLAAKDTYNSASGTAKGSIASTVNWNDDSVYDNLKDGDSININLDGTTKSIKFTQADINRINMSGNKAEEFRSTLQTKLNDAFGTEVIGGLERPKIIAEMNSGTLNITTGQGHTAIIQGGTIRNTAVSASAEMRLSDLGELDTSEGTEFSLVVGQDGIDKTITFKLKGDMTADQAAAAINKAISDAEPSIQSGLKATVNDGVLSFNVGNTNSTVTVSNYNENVLGALGFSGAVSIEPTNALNDFGFTSGISTKLDVRQTLGQAFGVASEVNFDINGRSFTFDSTRTIQEMINEVNSANIGVKLSIDTLNENFKLEAVNTGSANAIAINDTDGFLMGVNGLQLSTGARQAAQDSRFVFNGIETTRDSNNIDIAGIRMELTQVTSDSVGASINGGPVTITLEKDLSGTLDTVKKFVDAYNTMLDSLNKALNTNRPKKDSYNYFDPLTDAQKEAMKETDIKNWEDKAQQGMLYNDDLLQSVSSSLRSMLYQPVELSNGTRMSLFEIGITTSSDIRDSGKLIIDENKLTKALETRGADIAELFTKTSDIAYRPGVNDRNRIAQEGIAERMNDIINNAIGSAGSITKRAGIKGDTLLEMSSTMYRTIKDQNDRMAEMLIYLRDKETNYYQMFSRMEQAVTAANNQMAYLQAQLAF